MNYNIDLPEELKTVSKPKFKMNNSILTIYNRPFWDDWVFEIFMVLAILFFRNGEQIEFRNDYLTAFIAFGLFGLSYFSLNKINFDFEQKIVQIKNYNPLVNFFRKLFKMPSEVKFNEIEKIYPDWKLGGRGKQSKYFTILETDGPYKFRIAIFETESQSIIFTDYIRNIIKPHKIHTAQVSDTTVMP
jgi:hypothetical protein